MLTVLRGFSLCKEFHPHSSEADLNGTHFGSKAWKLPLEVTFSSSWDEVEQRHEWFSGFVGGLVPCAAAKHHQEVAASGSGHVRGHPGLRAGPREQGCPKAGGP